MSTKTITLTTDDDEDIELMVIEQTMINNVNYLLVTDSEEDEADAYILKETGAETEDAYYEFRTAQNWKSFPKCSNRCWTTLI